MACRPFSRTGAERELPRPSRLDRCSFPSTLEDLPMLTVRRDKDIHDIDGGWFRARWHFSFDTYRDPENDSFGAMRVFNDDRLVPGAVWPLHPHRDVEG